MSRPPRSESTRPLRKELVPREGRLDYLPLDFDALVALAARVGGGELSPGDGDPTKTLHELSALVAHVLAVHQDHFASEAFLGTAATTRSLVKHGRRLAYETSPGSTATGYLEIEVKPGLAGDVPANLVAATAPRAGAPAQDFETAVARRVDAAWNRLEVSERESIVEIPSTARELWLHGMNLGFRAGEPAILVSATDWVALDVLAVEEHAGKTLLKLASDLGVALGTAKDPASFVVLTRPRIEARLFGWNADPKLFPEIELETRTTYVEPPTPYTDASLSHGYEIPAASAVEDIFLSRTLDEQLVGQHVLIVNGDNRSVVKVASSGIAPQYDFPVRFVRGGTRQELDHIETAADGTVTPHFKTVLDERAIAATVTRLRLRDQADLELTRTDVGIYSSLFALWGAPAKLVSREPSQDEVVAGDELVLVGEHPGLEPGMVVALQTTNDAHAQAVELLDVTAGAGITRIRYKERTTTTHVWRRGNLVVLGNVVPIVHGTTREEQLGESDGITQFQRYKLKKAPLAYLASVNAVDPDLEVRVGGVRWERVANFVLATEDDVVPTARHYKIERDHDATWICFGDGRTSAVPPAGPITARYRVGLGSAGNVGAGRIARLVKNHPLVDRVSNPVPSGGGTEPASPDDVRRQATRFIRTFDRAVSIGDHADLALLFPGVARANARLANGAIELTAATAEGEPLPDRDKLFEFLDARRDTALPLVPKDPDAVEIAIHVYFEYDDAFLQRDVEAAIRTALFGDRGLFTFAERDLGQAAHASEVHAALAAVEGVTFAQLVVFDLAGGAALRDVIQPLPHQWLKLAATELVFVPKEPEVA